MNEIDHFKFFVLCSGDMAADMDHLHVKRIHLVSFSYIVIEDFSYSIIVPLDVKPMVYQWKQQNMMLPKNHKVNQLHM
jgi:uncharacterized membrane protein